ncbi:MAG: hypothetical protein BWZ10_01491 [candidate division BRC1 bacterium ADurb.BinA364]|nr:MAG: hypothetical protein BWZ10_01491 [candidate division BRC1 bacterium ADurb.BinA364]
MLTKVWLSSVVVKVLAALIGIVAFLSITTLMWLFFTSTPSECGVTSSKTTSSSAPESTPA